MRRTADADIIRLRKYEIPIKRVARNLCLDPALIAAIISQESRAGLLLDNGWDQGRQRFGLMQVRPQDEREEPTCWAVRLRASPWPVSLPCSTLGHTPFADCVLSPQFYHKLGLCCESWTGSVKMR